MWSKTVGATKTCWPFFFALPLSILRFNRSDGMDVVVEILGNEPRGLDSVSVLSTIFGE